MVSDKAFANILNYIENKGWISKEEKALMTNSWTTRPNNQKDIYQLQAYLDEVCEFDDYEHLINN